jgi:hypothetical protein
MIQFQTHRLEPLLQFLQTVSSTTLTTVVHLLLQVKMANWTYAAYIDNANGLVPCPTDLNGDGITKIEDFNILLGQFNVSCD